MMGRKDTASKRLCELFACEREHGNRPMLMSLASDQAGEGQIDCNHPLTRAVRADVALTLTDSPFDQPIHKAFQACDLDPLDPINWRKLLSHFAYAHFYKGTRGRKRLWDTEKWCRLLSDFDQIKKRDPKRSETDICDDLLKEKALGARYRKLNQSTATLRRNLQYARDPKYNELVRDLGASFFPRLLPKLRDICEKNGAVIDEAGAHGLATDLVIRWAIEFISTSWKRN
jgi:hypothetical protein